MFFREPATQAQAPSPAVRGVQAVEINIERLFSMRAGETIVLNLPGRAGVQLQHDRIESGWDSGKVWIGKTTDGGGLFHTFVSVSGASVNGTLSLPFGEFWLSGTVGSTSLSGLSAAGLQQLKELKEGIKGVSDDFSALS